MPPVSLNNTKSINPEIQGLLFTTSMLFLSHQAVTAQTTDVEVVKMVENDQIKFTVIEMMAGPGPKNKGGINHTVSNFPKAAMTHSFGLLKDKDNTDAPAFANAATQAYKNEYIPSDTKDQIIACTGIGGDGVTVEVIFTVPEKRLPFNISNPFRSITQPK